MRGTAIVGGSRVIMAKPRAFQVGGIYHIFNRGVDKREIFMKNQDYSRFILGLYFYNDADAKYSIWTNLKNRKDRTYAILKPSIAVPRTAIEGEERDPLVELLAFTLMPNHYHLIVREIKEAGISSFMHKMGGYSKYFNNQYRRSGVLFQGPYKVVDIKDDFQLVNIFNYVHTNPIELVEPEWKNLIVRDKEKAINYLNNYRWSSYRDYIGKPTFPRVSNRDFYNEFLGNEEGCRKSIEDWIDFKVENADLSQFANHN